MNAKTQQKLLDLYSKPLSEKFTDEELKFLKRHVKTDGWRVHYCLYPKVSYENKYVGFWIDYDFHNARGRKPEHYSMNVIATRKLNDKEIMWSLQNYGSHNRRFHGWWVHSVLWVIDMDRQYGIDTPQEFIDICNEKGYNHGLQQTLNFLL